MKIFCTIREKEVENTYDCLNCSQFVLCLRANNVDVENLIKEG
jgi:hypothetical protein